MPFHSYACPDCGSEWEEFTWEKVILFHCDNHPAVRTLSVATNNPKEFEPYLEHNMGLEPVYITSAKQREQELKKRGLRIKDEYRDFRVKEPRIKRSRWI